MRGLTTKRLWKQTDFMGSIIPSVLHNLTVHTFPCLSAINKQQKKESSFWGQKQVSQKTLHYSCFETHGIAHNYIYQLCCSTAKSSLWERAVVMCCITSSASHVKSLMKCRERAYLITIKNLLCFHLCSTELTVMARLDQSYLTPLS